MVKFLLHHGYYDHIAVLLEEVEMRIPVSFRGTKGVEWGLPIGGGAVRCNGECWTATQEKGQGCGSDGSLLGNFEPAQLMSGVLATGTSVCLSPRSRGVSCGGRGVFLYVLSPHEGVARVVSLVGFILRCPQAPPVSHLCGQWSSWCLFSIHH